MAGFEVIVRPMVLPNIRPGPARVLPPQDDPEKGLAVISGSSGSLIELPYSFSLSYSSNAAAQETKRQFDKERVYQVDGNGNINKNNYVDLERVKKIRMVQWLQLTNQATAEEATRLVFGEPPRRDNVEVLEKDVTRENK